MSELPSEPSKGRVIKVDFDFKKPMCQGAGKASDQTVSTHLWLQEGGSLAMGKQNLFISYSVLAVRKQLTENPKVRNKLEKV